MNMTWEFPPREEKIVTLRDVIGDLPSLDPLVKEEQYRSAFPLYEEKRKVALQVSKWHTPREHIWRNVEVMMHTPEGAVQEKTQCFSRKRKMVQWLAVRREHI